MEQTSAGRQFSPPRSRERRVVDSAFTLSSRVAIAFSSDRCSDFSSVRLGLDLASVTSRLRGTGWNPMLPKTGSYELTGFGARKPAEMSRSLIQAASASLRGGGGSFR